MASGNLAQLTNSQLKHLFEVSAKPFMSRRLKQVAAELERRGYVFDENEQDFVTRAEWNQRHANMPMDCNEQARLRSNHKRDVPQDELHDEQPELVYCSDACRKHSEVTGLPKAEKRQMDESRIVLSLWYKSQFSANYLHQRGKGVICTHD